MTEEIHDSNPPGAELPRRIVAMTGFSKDLHCEEIALQWTGPTQIDADKVQVSSLFDNRKAILTEQMGFRSLPRRLFHPTIRKFSASLLIR